jgi:hypothetical protein
MKKLSPLCFAFLLAACGSGTNDSTTQAPLVGTASAQRALTKIAAVTAGERRAYDIVWAQSKLSGAARSPDLSNFEFTSPEVRLPDISVTYDNNGLAGQLYRLYQAAFGRTPDVEGLGYWKNALEKNGLTLNQVGVEFLASGESKTLYGAQSDDAVFVERLYQNVLHRSADASGANYWTNNLKSGMKRADVLLGFADSIENRTATATAMDKGMAFAEPDVAYIPVSNATGPSDAPVGSTIDIDGSASTDANGDALHYSWTVTAKPAGSNAVFNDPTTAKTKITLDKAGRYELTLWVNDTTSKSYSPAKVVVLAQAIVADSGMYTCSAINAAQAQVLYLAGHTYLDRNKDGIACNSADLTFETAPTVPPVADTGVFKCSTISHETAILLYMQGHTYLDRDHDGSPAKRLISRWKRRSMYRLPQRRHHHRAACVG